MAWLVFSGSASGLGSEAVELRPSDDPLVSVTMRSGDVSQEQGRVLVRGGATALKILVPANSLTGSVPIPGSKGPCPKGQSRCIGGVEYCCDLSAIGACHGRWEDC